MSDSKFSFLELDRFKDSNIEIGRGPLFKMFIKELLDRWAATYNPLVLLGHDEDSGTTAVDSSGNGNDGTYEGSYTLGVDGPFVEDKQAVNLDASTVTTRVHTDPYAASGQDHAIILVGDFDFVGGNYDVLWSCYNSTDSLKFQLAKDTYRRLYWYQGTKFGTNRKVASGAQVIGLRVQSENSVVFYENGLPYDEISVGPRITETVATDKVSIGTNGDDAGGNPTPMDLSLSMHRDQLQTHEEFYQQAVDVGGAVPEEGHYYKETIIDDLGLATLGTQGDVLCHLPLWETDGLQAGDFSMRENHFDFINGPALGQDPLESQALHSVYVGTTEDIRGTFSGVDLASSDFTVRLAFKLNTATSITNTMIFGVDDTAVGQWFAVRQYNTNEISLIVDDGSIQTNVFSVDVFDGQTHAFCLRRKASTRELELWVDGVYVGALTHPYTLGPWTNSRVVTGNRLHTSYFDRGNFHASLPTCLTVAASDEDCIEMSKVS